MSSVLINYSKGTTQCYSLDEALKQVETHKVPLTEITMVIRSRIPGTSITEVVKFIEGRGGQLL